MTDEVQMSSLQQRFHVVWHPDRKSKSISIRRYGMDGSGDIDEKKIVSVIMVTEKDVSAMSEALKNEKFNPADWSPRGGAVEGASPGRRNESGVLYRAGEV